MTDTEPVHIQPEQMAGIYWGRLRARALIAVDRLLRDYAADPATRAYWSSVRAHVAHKIGKRNGARGKA